MKYIRIKTSNYLLLLFSFIFLLASCEKNERYFYLDKEALSVAGYYAHKIGDTIKFKVKNDTLVYITKSIEKKDEQTHYTNMLGGEFIDHVQSLTIGFNEVSTNSLCQIRVEGMDKLEERTHHYYTFYMLVQQFDNTDIKEKEYTDTYNSKIYNDLYLIKPKRNTDNINIIVSRSAGILYYSCNDTLTWERIN